MTIAVVIATVVASLLAISPAADAQPASGAGGGPDSAPPAAGPPEGPRPLGSPPGLVTAPERGELTVRGSVEQIHVIHAAGEASVEVRGPRGFTASATTDEQGGLVLREVPPGNGYTVTIEGAPRDRYPVRVLAPDDHPSRRWYAQQQLAPDEGYLTTRDGTLLAYQVELPDPEEHGPGPYPVVIDYSGYRPSIDFFDGVDDVFPEMGYAAVGVNMRGTACSGGAFDYFEPLQAIDGYDMVEALAAQDWVDGVGLVGKSYPGISQLFVAATQPPSLDAIAPGHAIGEFYRDVAYPGGVLNFAFAGAFSEAQDARSAFPSSYEQVNERAQEDPICANNQALRGQNVHMTEGVFGNVFDGDYWRLRAPERFVDDIEVPTLLVNTWQDEQTGSGPTKLLERFDDDTPARLLGTNGDHDVYYQGDVFAEVERFLDTYLGDPDPQDVAAYEQEEPVTILLELDHDGHANTELSLPSFEAAGDGARWFLDDDALGTSPGEPGATSTFEYDPPGIGEVGRGWLMPGRNQWLPPLQDRATFTTPALEEEVVMAGSGSVDLWVAASTEDVDLEVTLTEVRPDGAEMLIQSGWLRTSHRALDEEASTTLRPRHTHASADAAPLPDGELTPVRVELFPFAHAFRAGSSIRVTIDGPGGNRPLWGFDPIPGGDGATVTIAHDDEHPSSVALPVLDGVTADLGGLPTCHVDGFTSELANQPCRPLG